MLKTSVIVTVFSFYTPAHKASNDAPFLPPIMHQSAVRANSNLMEEKQFQVWNEKAIYPHFLKKRQKEKTKPKKKHSVMNLEKTLCCGVNAEDAIWNSLTLTFCPIALCQFFCFLFDGVKCQEHLLITNWIWLESADDARSARSTWKAWSFALNALDATCF